MMIMIKCCHDDYYGDATETNVTMMMMMMMMMMPKRQGLHGDDEMLP